MQDCEVNILGTKYTVKFKELSKQDIDGYTDGTSKEIVVRSDNEYQVGDFEWLKKKQLRHEIIHAFMNESGLQANWKHLEQFGHDETTVDWIAIQFPKILKVFEDVGAL